MSMGHPLDDQSRELHIEIQVGSLDDLLYRYMR